MKKIRAVYVDHGMRPETELATEFAIVLSLCSRLGIHLTRAKVKRGAIENRSKRLGIGPEAAARYYRMQAFRHELEKHSLQSLYLAHTRDDRLETILMRCLGGVGPRGIEAISGPIIRPFADIPKSVVLDFLDEAGLPFSVDSTNASMSYRRNAIRLSLIPALESTIPGWDTGLLLSAEKTRLADEAMKKTREAIVFQKNRDGDLSLSTDSFFHLPEALAISVLFEGGERLQDARRQRAASSAHGDIKKTLPTESVRRFSFRLFREAYYRLREGKSCEAGGFSFRSEGSVIKIGFALEFMPVHGYFLKIDDPGEEHKNFRISGLDIAVIWGAIPGALQLAEGSFEFPLLLRSRRPGDILLFRNGSKLIDVFLSEWGIVAECRSLIPILEDRRGVVAVLASPWKPGMNRYRFEPAGIDAAARFLSIYVKGV